MNPKVICYCCRQRIPQEDLRQGQHNHLDVEEQEAARVFAQYASGEDSGPNRYR